jgi:hypothetical protein
MNNLPPLRISTVAAEGTLQASKWLKCQVLLDSMEMEALFNAMGSFFIYVTSSVLKSGEGDVSKKDFLDQYQCYVTDLQQGRLPDEAVYRPLFSSVFTVSLDPLYAVSVGEGQQIIRVNQPVIQLQSHRMDYSLADGKFRSMTFGADSLLWGIQFSYPQLFQDNRTHEVHQMLNNQKFSNSQLFQKLQLWIRHHTAPTPMIVGGKKMNLPVRLGKCCFSWINRHPQLIKKGMKVAKNQIQELHQEK